METKRGFCKIEKEIRIFLKTCDKDWICGICRYRVAGDKFEERFK